MGGANFDDLLRVLRRERPERPTLFELFLNQRLHLKLGGEANVVPWTPGAGRRVVIKAFAAAGYDYATVAGSAFGFPARQAPQEKSRSLNASAVIGDRASFDAYPWQDPDASDYSDLEKLEAELPKGFRLIVLGPMGVLENAISLVGYEPLCLLTMDDPDLVQEIFSAIGSRLVRYYEICARYPAVGAMISNDDWGFNTQTMLPPDLMRKYVFPWHKRIVEVIHAAGKPAILHSCGNLDAVMDEIIDMLHYDAKHSFEDKICPVEQAYEKWGRRIAILGGIDLDFICRSTPQQVKQRSRAMLERTAARGGYALGTGNSVPEYVPDENYFAMVSVATEGRR